MNEYIILWFMIDGKRVASFCTEENLKDGFVDIDGKRNISEAIHVSRFRLLKSEKRRMEWSDRNRLFEKYPELAA